MPVLYTNQTINLPFDISKLDNLYQPYIYTEYNVCDDTCESDLNDHFAQIFPDCRYHSANEFDTCNMNSKCLPGVYFIHLNDRSLNYRQIEDYIKSLDYTIDVIAVSETWMSINSKNFYIHGYDISKLAVICRCAILGMYLLARTQYYWTRPAPSNCLAVFLGVSLSLLLSVMLLIIMLWLLFVDSIGQNKSQ